MKMKMNILRIMDNLNNIIIMLYLRIIKNIKKNIEEGEILNL